MKHYGSRKALGCVAATLVFALVGVRGAHADAPPLKPGGIVESKAITDNPDHPLQSFTVSVHVILQTHLSPVLAKRNTQDMAALRACRDSVLSTALFLAEQGVTAVVVEGFYAAGTLKNHHPLDRSTPIPSGGENESKWALLRRNEIVVYGFAIKFLSDYSNAIANELGNSSGLALSIAKPVGEETSIAQKVRLTAFSRRK